MLLLLIAPIVEHTCIPQYNARCGGLDTFLIKVKVTEKKLAKAAPVTKAS
jgi:hypothetical protein